MAKLNMAIRQENKNNWLFFNTKIRTENWDQGILAQFNFPHKDKIKRMGYVIL
jgi:hypothetical protein